MNIKWDVVIETMGIIATAVPRTLLYAVTILVFGILLGAVLAWIEEKRIPVVQQIINIIRSYIRGVPLIVHLFIMRYALPDIAVPFLAIFGLTREPGQFPAVVIVLTTYIALEGVIEAQNIRSALYSIDSSQIDAGKSIGMNNRQLTRRIIVPQALAYAVPLFLNAFLKIIKALSLAFTVGLVEILAQAQVAAALSFSYLESYIAAALIYWILCGFLSVIFGRISRRLQYYN